MRIVNLCFLFVLGISFSFAQSELGGIVGNFKSKPVLADSVYQLKDSKSQIVTLIFFSHNCPYCENYRGRIDSLALGYNQKGIEFLLVNSNNPKRDPNDAISSMRTYADTSGLQTPYLPDKAGIIAKSLGAYKNPQVFVLVKQGKSYRLQYKGSIDDNPQNMDDVQINLLGDFLDEVISGNRKIERENPPLGCLIKRF